MNNKYTLFRLDLFLFGEGGGGESAGGTSSEGTASEGEAQGLSDTSRQTSGEANTQTDAASTETTQESAEDRKKAYAEAKERFKDLYAEDTQKIINRRFKETKTLEENAKKTETLLDLLSTKYGSRDVEKITQAIQNDTKMWEDEAEEAGMSTANYVHMKQIEAQNRSLLQAEENRRGEERAREQVARWNAESEAVKQKFPSFDFSAELDNPEFVSLLRHGVPVEHAYKTIHFDELIGHSIQATAVTAEQNAVENIRARGLRPKEGTAGQSAFTTVKDVGNMSRKERADIAERVMRGEKFSL